MCFSHSSVGKEFACNAGDLGLIPGLGRSSGEENGNPLQYSHLENPMDREAWQAIAQGVARVRHDLVTKPAQRCEGREVGNKGWDGWMAVLLSPSLVNALWPHGRQASLSLTTPQSLPKFIFIALVMPSSHLILWCPLLLLPSIFPSIRDFSNELAVHIRWPKYWSFNISSSNECSGLLSLKTDWFDLFAVQGTLRSLLQHHRLKSSVLWCSAFFIVQLPQPYVTTGKTIALTIWTFVSRVMSLPFNTLSRFVTDFLPRSNLLISWLQSPCADYWLNGHEFEWTPGDSEGQGSLACYSPLDWRVGHNLATQRQ